MTGKPPARTRPRTTGRPTLATPDMIQRIIDSTRAGVPAATAAAAAGVSEAAFHLWQAKGREVLARRAAGSTERLTPNDDSYVEFVEALDRARGEAVARNVMLVQRAAQGGAVVEVTTRRYRDDDGHVVEERTERRQPPDWRAAGWWLERADRQFVRPAQAVEVAGPGGVPLAVELDVSVLAARLQEAQRVHEQRALAAGGGPESGD